MVRRNSKVYNFASSLNLELKFLRTFFQIEKDMINIPILVTIFN